MRPRDTLPPAESAQKANTKILLTAPKVIAETLEITWDANQCNQNWFQKMASILGPPVVFLLRLDPKQRTQISQYCEQEFVFSRTRQPSGVGVIFCTVTVRLASEWCA